jgi:hypothetical protein
MKAAIMGEYWRELSCIGQTTLVSLLEQAVLYSFSKVQDCQVQLDQGLHADIAGLISPATVAYVTSTPARTVCSATQGNGHTSRRS